MDVLVRGLNALLMVAMPLALGVFLSRRLRLGWGLFLVGAVTFIASQVAHIPFNQYVLGSLVQRWGIATAKSGWPLLALAFLLGLSAGVFEEGARYLVLRFWAKKARSWGDGLMFGAGHGGAEAIILGLLVALTLAQMIAYRGADMSRFVPAAQVKLATSQVAAYWSASWYDSLLGAVERAFAIACQVGMATLVMQAFLRRNVLWWLAAVAWHTLIDMAAVWGMPTVGTYATEGMIGLMALISVAMVWWLRPREPQTSMQPASMPGPVAPWSAGPVAPPTKERVNDTRFD